MESLKIPKRRSETIIQRRTDNTMAKTKRSKILTMVGKILHRKLKIEQHEPH